MIVHIDTGIMAIVLMECAGGTAIEAEDALRAIFWKFLTRIGQAPKDKGMESLDLGLVEIFVDAWAVDKKKWLRTLSRHITKMLHPEAKGDEFARLLAQVMGDIWRIYASALSVMGTPTSRDYPVDPLSETAPRL